MNNHYLKSIQASSLMKVYYPLGWKAPCTEVKQKSRPSANCDIHTMSPVSTAFRLSFHIIKLTVIINFNPMANHRPAGI